MIFLISEGLAGPKLELHPRVSQNPKEYIWDDLTLKKKRLCRIRRHRLPFQIQQI